MQLVAPLKADRWYHAAYEVDLFNSGPAILGTRRLYVNRVVSLSQTDNFCNLADGFYDFGIGACTDPDVPGCPAVFFPGKIAAVRASKTARYAGNGFTPAVSWTPDGSDIFHVRLEEGAGSQVTDLSGLHTAGTISGATWSMDVPSFTVYEVSPAAGLAAGGNTVTINGLFFTNPGDTVVLFGGNAATVVSVGFDSMTVQVPAGTPGQSVDVLVANSNGFASLSGGYTYLPKLSTTVNGTASTGGSLATNILSHLPVTGIYGLALGGTPLGSPIVIPPFGNGLSLFPFTIVKQGSLPITGASPSFPFAIDPSLAGVTLSLQGIAVQIVPLGGSFTNVSSFTIAP